MRCNILGATNGQKSDHRKCTSATHKNYNDALVHSGHSLTKLTKFLKESSDWKHQT